MPKKLPDYDERYPKARSDVMCADCGSVMRIVQGKRGPFYGCTKWPECGGTHGAHPEGEPLGIPADEKTKVARRNLHEKFDKLWKGGLMSRKIAYMWLQGQMKMSRKQCHVAMFDLATCGRATKIINDFLHGEKDT